MINSNLKCKCCNREDSTTQAKDMLCNSCFNSCKGNKCISSNDSNSKSYSYKKDCHLGPKLALDNKQGLKVYGSSYNEARYNLFKYDLIISLGKENHDVFSYKSSILRSIDYMKLIKSYETNRNPEHICLAGPDFSIPSLPNESYIKL